MMTIGVVVSKKYGCRFMFTNVVFIDECIECLISQLKCEDLLIWIMFMLSKHSKCTRLSESD